MAFRRCLDGLLRACRSLGDAYVTLYKDLKGASTSPAVLAAADPAHLRASADAFRSQLEDIEASEALSLIRNEGAERLASLLNDYADFLQQDSYRYRFPQYYRCQRVS